MCSSDLLAIAVVVEQRALGRELPPLFVMLLHGGTRGLEHFVDRRAAVLVQVRRRFLHCLHEVVGKHGRVLLRRRIGCRDHHAAACGQGFQEREAGLGRVDDRQVAGNAAEEIRPVLGSEVRPDEVELGDIAVVRAVPQQDDEDGIVLRRRLLDLGKQLADVLGCALVAGRRGLDRKSTRLNSSH